MLNAEITEEKEKVEMRKRVTKSLIYAIIFGLGLILGLIAGINAIYVSAKAKKVLGPGDEGWKSVIALQIIGWIETVVWILIIGGSVIASIAG